MDIQEFIATDLRLPSPPAIAIRILDEVRSDNFSFRDLARIIEVDPALVAKILKVANSPYYKCSRQVTTIEMAVSVLGTDAVKNLALSIVIFASLNNEESMGFDFDYFWRRAITAAVASELTATLVMMRSPDLFVTSLLQDIGVIILHLACPEKYRLVMSEHLTVSKPLHEIERVYFGFDHQEVGAEILKRWHLPEDIHLPIKYHHQVVNEGSGDCYKQSEVLKISDWLSALYHGGKSIEKLTKVKNHLKNVFDVRGGAVDELIDAVARKSCEILSSFDIPPGDMRPFSEIVQEANEELSKINNQYELLVIEMKQAKEQAEKLAGELHRANTKLQDMAFRDALTGLYNHRFFQEAMETELERVKRYQRELSLIIFDVDHFKKINDTYGHPAGDRVLAAIAKMAKACVRDADILARYGGEEFTVILPETDFAGAAAVAERLRTNIEMLDICVSGVSIKVTVSVGYTSYRYGVMVKGKEAIIGLADKALYIAKQNGRNKVHALRFGAA